MVDGQKHVGWSRHGLPSLVSLKEAYRERGREGETRWILAHCVRRQSFQNTDPYVLGRETHNRQVLKSTFTVSMEWVNKRKIKQKRRSERNEMAEIGF